MPLFLNFNFTSMWKDVIVKHHVIQRFHWWSNHEQNLHARTQQFENAYHTLFPTMLPVDRIKRLLELDSQAYNPDVVREIQRVVDSVSKAGIDAYDYRCLKWSNVFTCKK